LAIKRYDEDVDKLVEKYRLATNQIKSVLETLNLNNYAQTKKQASTIDSILNELDKAIKLLLVEHFENILKDSVSYTLKTIGKSDLLGVEVQAPKSVKNLQDSYENDTVADLQMITQNLRKKVRANIQRAQSRVLASKDSEPFVRTQLLDSVNFGMVDSAGRRWKPETYAKVVAETKTYNFYRDAILYTSLENKIEYAVISSHGATDICAQYEGKIVKFKADAPGNYPLYDDLVYSGEIFHIHCKHVLIPISSPDNVPDDISTLTHSPSFEAIQLGLNQDY
jgi:hypothetical protein